VSHSDPAPLVLEEGTLLAEKYRIGRPLGSGGMAEVFEAEHLDLGTRLAVKVLRPELTRSPTVVERFSREAQAVAHLESEHVARVVDVGHHEGAPFMVMERLDGQDLAARLTTGGPLPLSEAVDHLLQAGQALAEAHARGIVHRDIKPSNLFLAQRPPDATRIKVLDFGIAKSSSTTDPEAGKLTRTRDVLGSPLYMSPEQLLASSTVGPASDVWSLGVVLQELITGHPPFDGPSVAAIHAAILERDPAPLTVDEPEIARIIGRCLRKDPYERYPSIQDLAAELAPFGTHDALVSLRTIQSWASTSQQAARHTAPMAHGELDAVADTDVPDSMARPDRPGGVTDTSWDTDTSPGPRRGRGYLIALAALAVGGVAAFVTLRGDSKPARAPIAEPSPPGPTGTPNTAANPEPSARPGPPPTAQPSPSSTAQPSTSATAKTRPPPRPPRLRPRPVPPPPRPAPPPSRSPYDTPR